MIAGMIDVANRKQPNGDVVEVPVIGVVEQRSRSTSRDAIVRVSGQVSTPQCVVESGYRWSKRHRCLFGKLNCGRSGGAKSAIIKIGRSLNPVYKYSNNE